MLVAVPYLQLIAPPPAPLALLCYSPLNALKIPTVDVHQLLVSGAALAPSMCFIRIPVLFYNLNFKRAKNIKVNKTCTFITAISKKNSADDSRVFMGLPVWESAPISGSAQTVTSGYVCNGEFVRKPGCLQDKLCNTSLMDIDMCDANILEHRSR